MTHPARLSRRHLLDASIRGIAGSYALLTGGSALLGQTTQPAGRRVALTHGGSRGGNILEALKRIEPEIRRGLAGKERVLIKPNVVSTTQPLSATHAECLEALVEFFSGLTREEIVVAESAASGPTFEGYDHYGYLRLEKQHRVKFIDLDAEPVAIRHIVDERYRPQAVRVAARLLDPETYVVSAAVMKTHDRVVTTLSIKNLCVGATVKDVGFRWGRGSKGRSDKWLVHGGRNNEGIHFNLFSLGKLLRPDLAVIDGFQGMERNGPVAGTPVDHRVAVASTDATAADRVGVELMGFDAAKVGYLRFLAEGGIGVGDLSRIEVLGPRPAELARRYVPHENIERQYRWLQES